jgi:hypothetical protein
LQNFTQHKALDFMFDTVKQLSIEGANHQVEQDKSDHKK